jgi:hypothetical protein
MRLLYQLFNLRKEIMSNYPKVVNQYESKSGQPYQPSNGMEGFMFIEAFCDRCLHDKCNDCEIVARTMAFDIADDEYPEEWIYSEDGWPICTKWQKWDGGEDGTDNQTPTEPEDPNQLMFPFMVDEIIQTPKELELV